MLILREFVLRPEFQKTQQKFLLESCEFNLLILNVILVSLIGYWLNDWFDRDIDKTNKPHRFLVVNQISSTSFWYGIIIVSSIATLIATYLAISTGHEKDLWILPLALFLLGFYAYKLKNIKPIGNVLVSILIVGLVTLVLHSENLITDVDGHLGSKFYQKIGLYTGLIFTLNLCREIVKDLEDLKGDTLASVISFPTLVGVPNTRWIVILLLFICSVLEFFYARTQLNQWLDVLFFGVLSMGLFGIIWKLHSSNYTEDFGLISTLIKVVMALGVLQLITF